MSSTEVQIPEGFTPWEGGERAVPSTEEVECLTRCGQLLRPMCAGYLSWRHAGDKFDIIAYRVIDQPIHNMSFGLAIEALKAGQRVSRAGWNGKGMWLAFVPASAYEIPPGLLDCKSANPCNPEHLPWIGMKTADEKFVPWLASQTDVLADDWGVVE